MYSDYEIAHIIMLPRRFIDLFGSDYQPHSICAIS